MAFAWLSSFVPSLLALAPAASPPQDPPAVTAPATGFLARTLRLGDVERRYVVHVPKDYTKERAWPLVVFLNGMGECGTDGRKHVEVGLGPAIELDAERWPFVVAFPQKPDKQSQWADHEALVMGVLAATEQEFRIDAGRRFLTGLSQGGAGTWALGAKHADVWAAIAPVCGYGRPAEVGAALAKKPIWAFHGVDDKVVPAQQSKDLCAAVAAAGGDPVLTLYEKTAHNSWDQAYRSAALAEWLRTIVDQPIVARYLAEPARLDAVSLTITRPERTDGGAVAPRRVRLAAKGQEITYETSGGGAAGRSVSRAGDGPWAGHGESAREVVATLAQLARGGVFGLPAAPADASGYAVTLELAGRAGAVTVTAAVPAGPAGEPVRAVLDAIVARIEARL